MSSQQRSCRVFLLKYQGCGLLRGNVNGLETGLITLRLVLMRLECLPAPIRLYQVISRKSRFVLSFNIATKPAKDSELTSNRISMLAYK